VQGGEYVYLFVIVYLNASEYIKLFINSIPPIPLNKLPTFFISFILDYIFHNLASQYSPAVQNMKIAEPRQKRKSPGSIIYPPLAQKIGVAARVLHGRSFWPTEQKRTCDPVRTTISERRVTNPSVRR